MNHLGKWFETGLWNSRLVVLSAVVASLLVALAMFYVATVDVAAMMGHLGHYHDMGLSMEARGELRASLVTHVVEIVDGYLFGAIMLIFALGLYELFISRIDAAEKSEFASRLLLIHSLDDLKDRLAKVVLVILIVKFFENALRMHFETPLDLLSLAGGVLLIAGALRLTHKGHKGSATEKSE